MSVDEIRKEIKYRVEQEYEKYHNESSFEHNGKDFWIEQIVWKLGEVIEAQIEQLLVEARVAAYADCGSKGGTGTEVRAYAKSRANGLSELTQRKEQADE